MKLSLNNKWVSIGFSVVAIFWMLSSCKKNSVNGTAEGPAPQADFTMTQSTTNQNKYIVKANTEGVLAVKWDKGDGNGIFMGKTIDTLFFPDAGTYTVTLTAIGKGGLSTTATKQITIATSDPNAGNLVQGGKFETADDEAKWTRLVIGDPAVVWTRANGKMTATGDSWGHSAIYQTVQVQAGRTYQFSMLVSGSGATDTWFEVYFGTEAPVAYTDYSSGGTQIGLSTWGGCGNTAFSGNIKDIGCSGDLVGKDGKVTFTQGGTIYLLIKTGGSYLGDSGISIDNVEFRGT